MITVQEVVFNHLRDALKIRDRDQIFIHHNWDMRNDLIDPLIVVSVLDHQFLRIIVRDETVDLEAAIPRTLLEHNIYEPVSKKSRNKWRKKNIKPNIFTAQFSRCNIVTIALCEPRSIHKIEYCCNNIITTMACSLRRGYYGLDLKEGITKDFDLISNALAHYTMKHT